MANERPLTTFNYEIQISLENAGSFGLSPVLCEAAFAECDGLEMTMEPKTWREGGNNARQINLVGPVSYGRLTLKRGMTASLDLWKWFGATTAGAGRGQTATGVIRLLDASRKAVLRFTLSDCLPIKIKAPALNAKDGAVAIEEMQIAYAAFVVEAA